MKPLTFLVLLCLACLVGFAPSRPAVAAPQTSDVAVDDLLSLLPNWTTSGDANGVKYGASVSSAGDVDGDGIDDLIVGAPGYLVDGVRCGAALVFFGRQNGLSSEAHRVLSNGIAGSYFGVAVSAAGDVDGDGYDDVIVGASHLHATIGYDGAAYLYRGSAAGLSDAPAWQKIGLQGDSEFGFAVSGAGDVNHDGFDDVIVGAPAYSQEQNHEGILYLFLGSAGGLSETPAWSYQSDQAGAQLGYALSQAGDLNQDDYVDIIAGAPHFDSSDLLDAGQVLAFYGTGSGLAPTPAWQAQGSQAEAWFGFSLDGAGDVDGNGYPDLIVGAPGYDDGKVNSGAAFLFYNTPSGLPADAAWMLTGDQDGARFGTAVAGIGDADQDGFADVGVGAPYFTDDQQAEGFVWVYRGGSAGVSTAPDWWTGGDKADTEFGFALAGAGDVNGDGKADLAIGAPIYKRDERTVMGQAYVFHGDPADFDPTRYRLYLPLVQRLP